MLVAAACSEPLERAREMCRRAFIELLPPVMALVERRRLAGTLLYGKCVPHEVEWSRQIWTAINEGDANQSASDAPFMGYETYLKVAWVAIYWKATSHSLAATVTPPTAAQTQQIFSCAVTALDMMRMPRLEKHKDLGFIYEATLLNSVRLILEDGVCGVHHDALASALNRLEASGVIAARSLSDVIHEARSRHESSEAKAQADNEAFGLRPCAHCGAHEVHVAQFKRCGACKEKDVVYCCKSCQAANWPAHKAACKAARKAAAAAAAGGA
jgi:hypothetical protein